MTDIFAIQDIQDEISQAIANALKVKLAASRRSTTNVEAYQSCVTLRRVCLWRSSHSNRRSGTIRTALRRTPDWQSIITDWAPSAYGR
jgi:GTP cyclohydrolase I